MNESPVGIGIDEVVPHLLTIPSSWGTASSPTAVAKDSTGATVAGVVSAVSVLSNVISFTVTGSVLAENEDFRIEIKFTVTGGTLEAWGIWTVRL